MKEYQAPEIELLDFTAEPITNELPTLGLEDSPSDHEEI